MNFMKKSTSLWKPDYDVSRHVSLFLWTLLSVALGLFLIAIVEVVLYVFENNFFRKDLVLDILGVESNYEALKFLGIGIGGILLAMQVLIANERAKAMHKAAQAQADATKYTEKGQRQERLKNAIEHLGHNSVSVRLGGAYELFHLAKDTEELNQCQSIFGILCAHIRQTTSQDEYKEKYKSEPSEEIQSLLTLLFVREHSVFKGLHVNLQGSWLNGAELSKARLHNANLADTCLKSAWLYEVRLQGADLFKAMLQEAKLKGAQMQGAKLWKAQLQGAYLEWTKLQGADLYQAQFQGASLVETQLQGTSSITPGGRCSFEARIRNRIDEKSELLGVIFQGGINEKDVGSLVEGLSEDDATHLRAKLSRQGHVNNNASHELPTGRGAKTGFYTKEEAEQWIAEYKEAVSEPLKDDDY